MIDFSSTVIKSLVVHRVGNKLRDEGIVISKGLYQSNDDQLYELLLKYFLPPFIKIDTSYRFDHEADLKFNEVYSFVDELFKGASFYEQSVKVVRHLYNKSSHPKIKQREFYMLHLLGCKVDGVEVDAIGIFVSENKDMFLKVTEGSGGLKLNYEKGINIEKLDKGCLIYNLDEESGYRISIVDNSNRNKNEALYWKDDFLMLSSRRNEQFFTKAYLNICSKFCDDVYAKQNDVDKSDVVILKHDTLKYFSENDEFNMEEFSEDVLMKRGCSSDFEEYKKKFEDENRVPLADSFSISTPIVKKVGRTIRNQIKLDTGFEIKINPLTEEEELEQNLEKGFDSEKGMFYYKVYFRTEL